MSTIHERLRERTIKARINLPYDSGASLGLIILQPSGAYYVYESEGYTRYSALAEGVFAPLRKDPDHDQQALLIEHFIRPPADAWWDGIDEETANYVDHVLSLSSETAYLKVDRTRLADCQDAWIYVDVLEPSGQPTTAPISGFGECKGIFTWGDSD